MIPKTVDEARRKVIELYKEFLEVKPETKPGEAQAVIQNEDPPTPAQIARQQLDNYNLALYSLPWIKPFMIAWMVDVKFGDENPFSPHECGGSCGVSEEEAKEAVELLIESPGQFTEKQAGALGKNLQDYITNELCLVITDRGGSCCGSGGHIGCPCTDADMELMISSINIHFKQAIDAGLMAVKIAWFKPALFLNDNAMDAWIEGNETDNNNS